jgi:hypothetical protein
MATPNGSKCMDCELNTSRLREHFMLEQDVWESIIRLSERDGMLCVGCVELRLGRTLTPDDFDPAWRHLSPQPSAMLLSRRGY